jgi:hypothetical protein
METWEEKTKKMVEECRKEIESSSKEEILGILYRAWQGNGEAIGAYFDYEAMREKIKKEFGIEVKPI